jgi:vacuolar iron transporter family protein
MTSAGPVMVVPPHAELHRSGRSGWLRAAVLGANDGIVSTAALVVGVAASGASGRAVLASGIAGAVAGAMSMAAGEYVSVQSQADAEQADLAIERRSLLARPSAELDELTEIYMARGLSGELSRRVAEELSRVDALQAHARDELGITEARRARPIQAALASAGAFSVGSILPLASLLIAPAAQVGPATSGVTLLSLLLTGGLAAHTGGASKLRGALRLAFWGALAMLATRVVGELFQSNV